MSRSLCVVVAFIGFLLAPVTRAATPLDPKSIPRPKIPERTFNITDYGAVADGKTVNTDAIKKAIAACDDAGGGVVSVPKGKFVTGPIVFVSSMNLRIEKDATLLIVADASHFKVGEVELYPGKKTESFENCIVANDCHDIALTGEGTIDGQGEYWWTKWDVRRPSATQPAMTHRPYLIVFDRCERVQVSGLKLLNSPMFHLVPQRCRDVVIENLVITAPEHSHNTDAIDPSGWNIYIANCVIDVGDDNIVLKPNYPGPNGEPAVENVLVENCSFLHGHGMSVGGQTRGGLRNMTVRNCSFNGTDSGIRLKSGRGDGGLVEDIVFENIAMKDVKIPIDFSSYYPRNPKDPTTLPAQAVNDFTPRFRNVEIRNLAISDSPSIGRIWGLPEAVIENVRFSNVAIDTEKGLDVAYAKSVHFVNSTIAVKSGKRINAREANVDGVND